MPFISITAGAETQFRLAALCLRREIIWTLFMLIMYHMYNIVIDMMHFAFSYQYVPQM